MILLNVFGIMTRLFVEGGSVGMSIVTIIFVGMLFAAWKAPNWVEELGQAALVFGIMWFLVGINQAFNNIFFAGDIAPSVVCSGLKVASISIMYGVMIYILSLVIRSVQKLRV